MPIRTAAALVVALSLAAAADAAHAQLTPNRVGLEVSAGAALPLDSKVPGLEDGAGIRAMLVVGWTPRITGYEVSNLVTITVRDLDNFGAVLDAAVSAGGNQVSDIRFGFSNPQGMLDQALELV